MASINKHLPEGFALIRARDIAVYFISPVKSIKKNTEKQHQQQRKQLTDSKSKFAKVDPSLSVI